MRMCSSWAGVGISTLEQIVQTCGMPENPDPPCLRLGWKCFLTLPLREHTPGVSHFPQSVSIVPHVLMGCSAAPRDLGHFWGCAAGAGSISDLTGTEISPDLCPSQPGSDSGTTAVVALIRGKQLIVANAGDSRCVVSEGGKAVDMSYDHKPEDEVELARIKNAGGKVTMDGRVNGGLNLSRAIGKRGAGRAGLRSRADSTELMNNPNEMSETSSVFDGRFQSDWRKQL